ncbi:hypothetical protein VNO77_04393 [Canavalia gladiata]|uniref:Uncharacterized protein n=1 Tax=Canavalia gladiata TaxID=3824 RepID=A0AAN9RD53_CANGL
MQDPYQYHNKRNFDGCKGEEEDGDTWTLIPEARKDKVPPTVSRKKPQQGQGYLQKNMAQRGCDVWSGYACIGTCFDA